MIPTMSLSVAESYSPRTPRNPDSGKRHKVPHAWVAEYAVCGETTRCLRCGCLASMMPGMARDYCHGFASHKSKLERERRA